MRVDVPTVRRADRRHQRRPCSVAFRVPQRLMQAQRARRSRQLSKIEASSQAIPPRDSARTKVAAREPLQFGVLRLMYGFEFGFALAALTDRFRLSFQPLDSFRVETAEA